MKKSFIIALSVLVALASCNKEAASQGREDAADANEVAFTIGGNGIISTDVLTRTSAVESLTQFNVGAVTGTAGSSEVEVWNGVFSGGPTYTGGKYWPTTDPHYVFYASNLALSHRTNGYTVAATNDTDAVCAYLGNPGYKASNKLVFEHIFARLGSVTVSVAENYTISGIDIRLTPKTGGTFSIFSGYGHTDGTGWSSTTSGTPTAIANAAPGTKQNDIYLVPGSYTLTASWTATRGASVQTFTSKTQEVSLVGGKVNNIVTTLGGSASEIEFTVEIKPWEDNDIVVNFSAD